MHSLCVIIHLFCQKTNKSDNILLVANIAKLYKKEKEYKKYIDMRYHISSQGLNFVTLKI